MKVIVELENPKSCDSCPLMDVMPAGDYNDAEYFCIPGDLELNPYMVWDDSKPDWCPLRPKSEPNDNITEDEKIFIRDCIYMAAAESFYNTDFYRNKCEDMALSICEKLGTTLMR